METRTNWTEATQDIHVAMFGVLSALKAGHNAWLEYRKNGDQQFPIKIVNPELNDKFNWTMLYGVPWDEKLAESHRYINAIEKDLTLHHVAKFGEPDAIATYQKTGEVTKGLLKGMGTCFPFKLDPKEQHWMFMWRPLDGIAYHVVDPSIENVFVVCWNDDKPDTRAILKRMAGFIDGYADSL